MAIRVRYNVRSRVLVSCLPFTKLEPTVSFKKHERLK